MMMLMNHGDVTVEHRGHYSSCRSLWREQYFY